MLKFLVNFSHTNFLNILLLLKLEWTEGLIARLILEGGGGFCVDII